MCGPRYPTCVKFPNFLSLPPCMRIIQVYVDDAWDVRSYRTKLETLYRVIHGLKKRFKVDSAKVQRYSEWLIPKIEQIYRYMKQTYTNISVLSSMMLPVVSVLRKELGLHDQTTDMWRQEATDLRIQATQEASRNVQGKDFKTYQDICRRRDDIKCRVDSDPTNTTDYWKWFALCLYTMQPPLRADWAGLSIVGSIEKASSSNNYLVLTSDKALILIQHDKVSHRKGGAHIPVTDGLHAVLLDSIRTYPRSVVVPYIFKASRNAMQLSYRPHKHISRLNLSKLLGQAMALADNTPWPRPIHGLRKAHSTFVMSSHTSYHRIKEVADAQRHSVSTMMRFYNSVSSPSGSHEDGNNIRTPQQQRIASAIQQAGLCLSDVIIMARCEERHGDESSGWTLYCSNPEFQASAEQSLAIINDTHPSGGS